MLMRGIIKHIYISLLIVIFLLPSTGVILSIQQCNMSKKMTIELEQSNLCCNTINHDNTNDKVTDFIKQWKSSVSDIKILSPLPCCKNEKLFVKLGNQLLSKTQTLIKNFTTHIPFIISAQQALHSVEDTSYYNYLELLPPGPPAYIELASLRL
jgi:hypothetical protein